MIFKFTYLLILLVSDNYAMLKVKDSLKKKDTAFVENLKQDLRRNNDDYADLRSRTSQSSNYTQQSLKRNHLKDDKNKILNSTSNDMAMVMTDMTVKASNKSQSLPTGVTESFSNFRRKHKEDERIKKIDEIRKRVHDALLSSESKYGNNPQRRRALDIQIHVANNSNIISTTNIPTIRGSWKNMNKIKHRFSDKMIRHQMKQLSKKNNELTTLPVLTTLSTTTTNMKYKPVNQIKKKKLQKFKKFIENNRGLLKDFISSKVASQSSQTPAVPVPQNPSLRQKLKEDSMNLKELELQQVMREAVEGLKRKESLEQLPRAELLDMAPAKGGRIHKKRLRGRLCQRNVLLPEGPKYSSGGRAYVPPHAGGRAREYNATAEPRLLLPRCCNCCRKSVLGCE